MYDHKTESSICITLHLKQYATQKNIYQVLDAAESAVDDNRKSAIAIAPAPASAFPFASIICSLAADGAVETPSSTIGAAWATAPLVPASDTAADELEATVSTAAGGGVGKCASQLVPKSLTNVLSFILNAIDCWAKALLSTSVPAMAPTVISSLLKKDTIPA
jgi:hypothetical protein